MRNTDVCESKNDPFGQGNDLGHVVTRQVTTLLDRSPDYSPQLDNQPYGSAPKGSGILIDPDFHDGDIFPEGNPREVPFAVEHNGIWYYNRAGAVLLAEKSGKILPTLELVNVQYKAKGSILANEKGFLFRVPKKCVMMNVPKIGDVFPQGRIHISDNSSFWLSPETVLGGQKGNYFAYKGSSNKEFIIAKPQTDTEKMFTARPVLFVSTGVI